MNQEPEAALTAREPLRLGRGLEGWGGWTGQEVDLKQRSWPDLHKHTVLLRRRKRPSIFKQFFVGKELPNSDKNTINQASIKGPIFCSYVSSELVSKD